MNSSSKVIMVATMVMAVSLVMVLSLVLVLLGELYCSLLLRRQRRRSLNLPTTAATATTVQVISTTDPSSSRVNTNSPSPLNTVYSQGVLQPPFYQNNTKSKTHLSNFLQILDNEPSQLTSPDSVREIQVQIQLNDSDNEKPTTSVAPLDNFIYISNPMYSNDAISKPSTPFETPQTSPSRLETGDSSSSGEEDSDITENSAAVGTPTLTPMKNLPEKACSVSLKDVRSLESSPSESNSHNGESSSSSGSPYTSPSW